MRHPIFSVRDMNDRWGCWFRDRREISISRHLVLNHSWDAVREVLLHEMAHQYADEVLGARSAPAHGPLFIEACHVLRANPKASGTFKPLDERIVSASNFSQDKIMRRIKKLMALASSQNRHEAEAAMAKAQELMLKYNEDILVENKKRGFESAFLGKPALRHTRMEYLLACLIKDFYFVKGIWMPSYILKKGKMGTVFEISGTVQNIRIACYVFHFVINFIHSQWADYNKNKEHTRHRKTDFGVGIIEGFRSTLSTHKRGKKQRGNTHLPESRALVKIEDPLLKEYFKYKYPHTVTLRRGSCRMNKKVMEDGICIGKKLVIYKGIQEKKEGKGLLLEKK